MHVAHGNYFPDSVNDVSWIGGGRANHDKPMDPFRYTFRKKNMATTVYGYNNNLLVILEETLQQ
jgi:hypothetical protein